MRLRRIFIVIVACVTFLAFALAVTSWTSDRRYRDGTAVDEVGTSVVWPDGGPSIDPRLALSVLTEAAISTHSNVVRRSSSVTEAGRTKIDYYVLLTQPHTELFDKFDLESGRWPSGEELTHGLAKVTTDRSLQGPIVGVPAVPFRAYDLSFLGMPEAFGALPTAGRYVVESPTPAAFNSFVEILSRNLTNAGVPNASITALRGEFGLSEQGTNEESPLGYVTALVAAMAVLIALAMFWREFVRVGILRLNGFSVLGIWFHVVGRSQILTSVILGVACLTILWSVASFDSAFVAEATLTWAFVNALCLTGTLLAAWLVVRGVTIVKLVKAAPVAGRSAFAVLAIASAITGAFFSSCLAQVATQKADLVASEHLVRSWEGSRDYAIFYPRMVGNDASEIASGGNASTISEARDLYPVLDAQGAIFVDSLAYETPGGQWSSGARIPLPIRVNLNYLQKYPLLDENGQEISVRVNEQDWVVGVPEQYKSYSKLITDLFQARRTGNSKMDGAYQGETKIVGTPDDRFRSQKVRIVWMKQGQNVFAFSQEVRPEQASMIRDPIVEIMTPNNSLPIDRFNAVTGTLGTALKVKLDGSSARTLARLEPTLEALHLDDNLRYLVTPDEAALESLAALRRGEGRLAAIVAGTSATLIVLTAALSLIVGDRYKRQWSVRRLHGSGFFRARSELWAAMLMAIIVHWGLVFAHFSGMVGLMGTGPASLMSLVEAAAVTALMQFAIAFVVSVLAARRSLVSSLKRG